VAHQAIAPEDTDESDERRPAPGAPSRPRERPPHSPHDRPEPAPRLAAAPL